MMSTHVSAAEAARMYRLSDKTVRRWIKAGKLRADIRDGAYLVAPDDVSALVGRGSARTLDECPDRRSARDDTRRRRDAGGADRGTAGADATRRHRALGHRTAALIVSLRSASEAAWSLRW